MRTWLTRTCNACFVVLLGVFSGWLLTSCRGKATDTKNLLSVIATPVVRAMVPTFTAVPPTIPIPTSTPYPTPLPTLTLFPTPLPTIVWADFSSTEIAAMGVYQPVQRDSQYMLYRISNTPLGVANLEWSPNSTQLWLNVATGPGGYAELAPTAPLIISYNGKGAWSPGLQGESILWPESHSWAPDGHELVYARDGQLWLLKSTGAQRQLLKLPTDLSPSAPQFSPDGQQIAFTAGQNAVGRLILSTGEVEALAGPVTDGQVRWAPGSDALATIYHDIQAATANGATEVVLNLMPLPLDKVVRVPLTRMGGSDACCQPPPTWTADGQKVMATVMLTLGVWLVDRNGQVELLVAPLSQHTDRRVPGLAAPLRGGRISKAFPSPKGDYVIYTTEDGLHLRTLATGADRQISDYVWAEVTWAQTAPTFLLWSNGNALMVGDVNGDLQVIAPVAVWPALSPDGRRILFWFPEAFGYSLWSYDRAQAQANLLLPAPQTDPDRGVTYPPYHYDIAPQWSPDGSKVAFVAWLADRPEAYLLEIAD